jgi:hypothetical protein
MNIPTPSNNWKYYHLLPVAPLILTLVCIVSILLESVQYVAELSKPKLQYRPKGNYDMSLCNDVMRMEMLVFTLFAIDTSICLERSNSSQTSKLPLYAAQCKGVQPLLSRALTST